MEHKVSINNNSVEFAGITKDYMEAVSELIWNGFDAGATSVDLVFDTNEIDFIPSIEIIDNGSGIHLHSLHQTFGSFLDSLKRGSDHRSSYVRGKKGKGRFSFIAFAQRAGWNTTYYDVETDQFINYDVQIDAQNKDFYADENKSEALVKETGTRLTLANLFGVTAYSFTSEAFINYLKSEFGWFLLLNSKRDFKLCINGEKIRYEDILADHEVFTREFADASTSRFSFTITFVRWNEKIGDKFYYYFLNSDKKEVFKQLTSFNNNAINFYHSIYVESDYFNLFNSTDLEETGNLFGSNQQSAIFKQLIKALQLIVFQKQKEFVSDSAAEDLIKKFELTNSIPHFGNTVADMEDRKRFINLIKTLYCIQPRLFKSIHESQEKLTLNLIAAQMKSGNELLEILRQILHPDEKEQQQLTQLLANEA